MPGSPGWLPGARALARRLLDEVAAEAVQMRLPLATYRVQLHKGFTFDQALAELPYLAELGITDLYTSPYMKAAQGSNHGYDVLDHQLINPEIGGAEGHARLAEGLRKAGLGHVLDVVPNHMGVGAGNPLWLDLLENGPSANSARFFDVDWHPLKPELENQVLLPVLGDRYGAVLENGQLQIRFAAGSFELAYFDRTFPLNPRSYPIVLNQRLDELEKKLPAGDAALDDFKSILTALQNLPPRTEQDRVRIEERRREKEVIKRRLSQLCEESEIVRAHVEANVKLANGTPGDPHSFDLLDKVLAAQAYRLSHWRVSSEEINYRRFFDINELAAIRVEDPVVFEEAHRLPLQLVARGVVTGLRIDHPDGLADPTGYFRNLQESWVLQKARAIAERLQLLSKGANDEPTWEQLEPHVRKELAREVAEKGAASPLANPLYVVAEKILGGKERLPESWAVRGTTGYDFLNQLNGLFVKSANEREFDRLTARFTGRSYQFRELVYEKKKLILYSSLVSEVNVLARQLSRIAESNRWTRDFTLYSLRSALVEVVASFPVYRTYVDESGCDERDRSYIEQAVRRAKRMNPTVNGSIFDFIADILLQRFSAHVGDEERKAQLQFAIKLQQVLGPVMAKGLEDTTLYVYNRLVSLNEVGGQPEAFGHPPSVFHAAAAERAKSYPRSLLATATHDTKRGEDVRARIDALSEVPAEWADALQSFAKANARFKSEIDGREAPDRNEELLLYQSLLGAWPWRTPRGEEAPLAMPPAEELKSIRERVQAYLNKATKEAKVNTSWIQPDDAWDSAVAKFVAGVVEQPAASRFWRIFLPLARKVAQVGMHNSLSQVLLKIAAPGVPDLYQGCELWDLSLVDPDNRRPVDFELRKRMLRELDEDRARRGPVAAARERYLRWEDGAVKLLVTALALRARRDQPALFGDGTYVPLAAEGPNADRLCAFARQHGSALAVAVAPRLIADLLTGDDRARTLPARVWSGALLPIPGCKPGDRLTDVFTDDEQVVRPHASGGAVEVDALFGVLPVSLLVRR